MNKCLFKYLHENNLVFSRTEYKRLAIQGGIKVNNEKLSDWMNVTVKDGDKINIGKSKEVIVK